MDGTKAMTKAIKELIEQSKWKPIEEAPVCGGEVLIKETDNITVHMAHYCDSWEESGWKSDTGFFIEAPYMFKEVPDDRLAEVCALFLEAIEAALDDMDLPEIMAHKGNKSMLAMALKQAEQIAKGEG